jgi:hypothetical protein
MSYEVPEFSPGCYGSVLGFKKTDMICGACVFNAQCEVAHTVNTERMRLLLGVKTPPPFMQPEVEEPKLIDPSRMALPKKVQALLDKLDQGGYDIAGKLRAKLNPFGASLPHMAVACHLLLKLNRPLDRELLVTSLMAKLKWSRATAEEQARVVNYALIHTGAVTSQDGVISLKGNI